MIKRVKETISSYWKIVKKNVFIRHVLSIIVNGGFLYILTFLNSVVIARSLGPEGQGIIGYSNTIVGIAVHFGGFGMDLADRYYIAKDKKNLPGAIGNAIILFVAYLFLGLTTVSVLYGTREELPVSIIIVLFIAFKIPIDVLNSQVQNMLLALTQVRVYNRCRIVSGITYPFLVFLSILFKVTTPEAVIFSALISGFLGVLLAIITLFKSLYNRIYLDFKLFREMLPYGSKMYIAVVFNFLLLRCDILMIEHLCGKVQTGIYSLATSLADVLLMITSSVSLVLTTKLIEMPSDEERFDFENNILAKLAVIMGVVASTAAIVSGWAIQLIYGEEYVGAIVVFRCLMPGIFFWGLNSIISSFLSAVNKLNVTVVASGLAFFSNIVLNFVLIKKYGIIGAGISSSISYGLDMGIRAFYYRRLFQMSRH